jgi:hypothetical protein
VGSAHPTRSSIYYYKIIDRTRTGLDLLSNIPKFIQNALESRRDDSLFLSAPLLTNKTYIGSELLITPVWPFDKFSILQSGLEEETGFTNKPIKICGTFETSVNQRGFVHIGGTEISILKSDTCQNGFVKIGKTEISTDTMTSDQFGMTQVGMTQVGMTQVGVSQINSQHFNSNQVSIAEIDSSQISSSKYRSAQIDPSKIDIGEYSFPEINIGKITFSSSISSQQGSSFYQLSLISHNFNPLLTDIYSTVQTLWHTTIPTALTFNITNLPTGQLAEGTANSNLKCNAAMLV